MSQCIIYAGLQCIVCNTLSRSCERWICCKQAVTFLVIHQKNKKSFEEITNDLCPVLSVQQLYRISTMYWDDRFGTETVSHEVLARMKQLMVDNQSAASHSFLLDDDSSIPFSLDDIQNLMEDRVSRFLQLCLQTVCPALLPDAACFEMMCHVQPQVPPSRRCSRAAC